MLIQTTKVADTCFRQVSYPFAQGSPVFRDRLADYLSLIYTGSLQQGTRKTVLRLTSQWSFRQVGFPGT